MIVGDAAYWDDFFQQKLIPEVLNHILCTWQAMQKPGQSDLEDAISVKLYAALVNGKDRSRHAFLIRYQDIEVDIDLAKVTGRKDIVIYPSTFEEIYFCLEAKRLNAMVSGVRRSLADEYVKDGMQRFVDGKYSRHVRHGGMLGYVLDGDVTRAMTNVQSNIRANHRALRMDPPGDWRDSAIGLNDPRAKESRHVGIEMNTVLRIHHLFVAGGPTSKTNGGEPPIAKEPSENTKSE